MRHFSVPVMALAVGLLGCATASLHERAWVEVRTSHFRILSCMSPGETATLARDLELFRSVVEFVTGEKIPTSPVPTRVYAFDGMATYRPFQVDSQVVGYFGQTARDSVLVFADLRSRWIESEEVMKHEYVHFLLRNRGHYAYPPWYDEGLAEFLSTVEVRRDLVHIGRAPDLRVETLRRFSWLPLESVLAARNLEGWSGEQVAMFYAESWAFIHYLNFGREDEHDTTDELTRYLRILKKGGSNEAAVRDAFGARSAQLGHRMRRYLEKGRYPYVTAGLEHFDTGSEPELRTARPGEVAIALGRLSLLIDRPEQARRHFDAALALDPGGARALAGTGDVLSVRQEWAAAEARYEAAIELAPEDPLVHLDYANSLHHRAAGTEDPEERGRLAKLARKHYVRSWKLDDAIPETYAGYGATFLLAGQEPARGIETLEHAHGMLPANHEISVSLAKLYGRLGRAEEARELALVTSMWHHSDELDEEFLALISPEGAGRGEDSAASRQE